MKNEKLNKDWIIGFVDGDGYFGVSTNKKGHVRYRFVVSQDRSSISVLYKLQEFFECGNVNKSGGSLMEYNVGNKQDLIKKIIPFFSEDKNQLRTEEKWNQFIFMRNKLYDSLGEPNKELSFPHPLSTYPQVWNKECKINKEWLTGFIDAEGCFYVSLTKDRRKRQRKKPSISAIDGYPRPKCFVGHNSKEIIYKIYNTLNIGTVRQRQETFWIWEVSALQDFKKLDDYLTCFHTKKQSTYILFCQIIKLIEKKEHLTLQGFESIKSFKEQMNK